MKNLYWPVYKKLEKEVLSIADIIHFDDKQLNVYSIWIADVIIRCSIEIEAISKDLYEQDGGNMNPVDDNGSTRDLYFDTDCLALLEQNWLISKKVVNVVALNFYFEKEENLHLTPLHKAYKRGTSGSKWKQAYQNLKHDRKKTLEKYATVGNLINAMAALFLLNIYYAEDSLKDKKPGDIFDGSFGSEIFTVNSYSATGLQMSPVMDDASILNGANEDRDTASVIDKYTEKSYKDLYRAFIKDSDVSINNFANSPLVHDYFLRHPEISGKKNLNIVEICTKIGEEEARRSLNVSDDQELNDEQKEQVLNIQNQVLTSIMCFRNTRSSEQARREYVLNKGQHVYPTLTREDLKD